MFNDEFGLTKAVLEGRKTMTRRIVPKGLVTLCEQGMTKMAAGYAKYYTGEIVAVAQAYRDVIDTGGYPHLAAQAGWANKMFIRASLMPHQIRITSIRVERLQEISEADCLREGIYKKTLCPPGVDYFYHSEPRSKWDVYPSPREAFAGLIDKVSGKGTWERNPWVFVYEFELVN